MDQTISQSDSYSTENHFSEETKMFLFLSESENVTNAPLVSKRWFLKN
jgi:hypothetical protein